MSTLINPSLRFKAHDVKLGLPRGSEAYRLLDKAQLVEGFPHCYPSAAAELAASAIVAVGVAEEITPESLVLLRQMAAAL